MVTRTPWASLAALALLAGSCQILSYTWAVPSTVAAGSVFSMDVTGVTTYQAGLAWAVFQVPIGFEVLGAGYVVNGGYAGYSPATADPTAMASYVASPGHQLFGVSGQQLIGQSAGNVDAKIYVRAPSATGSYTLRMALAVGNAGALQPQLGLGSFQVPGGSASRAVQVASTPPTPPFELGVGPWDQPSPRGAAATDVDRDGRAELLLVNQNDMRVLRRDAQGFSLLATIGTPTQYTVVTRATTADLDNDGFIDIVHGSGVIWFGGPGPQWPTAMQLPLNVGEADVAVGDFEGNGIPDIAVVSSGNLAIALGLGNRTFAPLTNLPLPAMTYPWLLVEDLDIDGRSELLVGDSWVASFTQFWHLPAGAGWTQVAGLPPARGAVTWRVAGLTGKDVLLSGSSSRYRWNTTGLTAIPAAAAPSFARASVADFDGDGREDLLWAQNGQQATLALWRQAPTGQLVNVPLPNSAALRLLGTTGFTNTTLAADFDGDTWPDAFVATDAPLVLHNGYAGARAYGSGCGAGALPAAELQALGAVGSGQNITLQVAAGQVGAATLLWIGDSNRTWFGQPLLPLDLAPVGAPGCTLLAEPRVVVATITDATGVATLPVTLPTLPTTVRATVFLQGAVIDPAANPLGARFSQGLAVKIQ